MRSVLVLGSGGMLGWAVTEYFMRKGYRTLPVARSRYDIVIDPISKLEGLLDGADFVVNCTGVIKPMITSTPIETVLQVNSIFPRNLAKLCSKRGIACFHITTDGVFSGKKGSYTELDLFDAAPDVYGMSKNAGESNECMVLRVSVVGEENGARRSLLEWAKSQSGREVNGITNHFWNGMTTLQLAQSIEAIVQQDKYSKGVFHLYSPEKVSKHELLGLFNETYRLSLKIEPIEAKEFCDRTLSSIHSLSSLLGIKNLRSQIQEMRSFFDN